MTNWLLKLSFFTSAISLSCLKQWKVSPFKFDMPSITVFISVNMTFVVVILFECYDSFCARLDLISS